MLLAAAMLLAATAAPTPGAVARLVLAADDPSPALAQALHAPDALTRAAAARVAAVRGATALIAPLREALAGEQDFEARREDIRALILLGEDADIDAALQAAEASPVLLDAATAAISRRSDAFELFESKLRPRKVVLTSTFLRQALWQRAGSVTMQGARIVGRGDAAAWRLLLDELSTAKAVMTASVLGASLNASSEEIRVRSLWHLVHSYAADPSRIDSYVRSQLEAPREDPTLREAFGRELLARMGGKPSTADPRFIEWLQSPEADELIGGRDGLFEYFTEEEFRTRKAHCGLTAAECRMPEKRGRVIPSQGVIPAPFMLPGVLPTGLAAAVLADTRCRDGWLALGAADVDMMGRVRRVDLTDHVRVSSRCQTALQTLMRLSLAAPASIVASSAARNILLAGKGGETACLDEGAETLSTYRVGTGSIVPPKPLHRVEPSFPADARRQMGPAANVLVIMESLIARTGCVRSIQLLAQSPYPSLNGAAVDALAQWTFEPGRLDGKPVDVLFNLTVQFRVGN
jgi:protein TonB